MARPARKGKPARKKRTGRPSDYFTQPGKRGAVIVLRKPIGNRATPKVCGVMPTKVHARMLVNQLELPMVIKGIRPWVDMSYFYSLMAIGLGFDSVNSEFNRRTLEVLRQPLESGNVTISRAMGSVTFPASLMLVAALNPCPCGYSGDPRKACRCRPDQQDRYRHRLSGPLLDRIDLRLTIPRLTKDELLGASGDDHEP